MCLSLKNLFIPHLIVNRPSENYVKVGGILSLTQMFLAIYHCFLNSKSHPKKYCVMRIKLTSQDRYSIYYLLKFSIRILLATERLSYYCLNFILLFLILLIFSCPCYYSSNLQALFLILKDLIASSSISCCLFL